jgi:poly(3-hydroxybutyrate) depolymerase
MRDKNPAQETSVIQLLLFIFYSLPFPTIIHLLNHIHALFTLPTMSGVTEKARIASFGGKLLKLSHNATTTRCEMSFNLYLPPGAVDSSASGKVPVLIYLSGLTCTAENCSEKGFFQHGASKKGIAVLYPDTSPRM